MLKTMEKKISTKKSHGKSSIEEETVIAEDTCQVFLLALTGFSGSLGIILFITGCVVTSDYSLLLDLITGKYTEASLFMLLIGILVIIVSAIGFYAALKSHYILMSTFLTVMIICVISEVIGSITMFALNRDSRQHMTLHTRLLESLSTYDVTPSRITETWDLVQTELECCGVRNQQDYNITPFYQKKNHLPSACCGPLQLDTFGHAEKCSSATKSLYNTGCNDAMGEFLRGKMGALGGIAASIAILQIAIITSAVVLIKKWTSPSHCYPCF